MEATLERADEHGEVELSGFLAEFRTALREEIDAARRTMASAGVQLLNGRLIGRAADAYQYVFSLESVLNLPDDLPGELRVPGRRPVEATIVSLEGVAITISVPEQIGDFVARASLQTDLTMLLRLLIERIEKLSQSPNPAGDRLLGNTPPSGEPSGDRIAGLNASQAGAVASALGRDTTFVWGPPGTGKTRTIGKIGEQLARRERSVLLVSHTNSAVDQAILEIVRDLGEDLVDGAVLRLGTPKDRRLAEQERLLAETHIKERSQTLLDHQAELLAERALKAVRLEEVRRFLSIAEWRVQADSEIARLREEERRMQTARDEAATARAQAVDLAHAVAAGHELATRAGALKDRLSEAEPIRAELVRRETSLAQAEQRLHEAERLAREAQLLYEDVVATGAIRRRLRRVPRPEEQAAVVGRRRGEETSDNRSASATGVVRHWIDGRQHVRRSAWKPLLTYRAMGVGAVLVCGVRAPATSWKRYGSDSAFLGVPVSLSTSRERRSQAGLVTGGTGSPTVAAPPASMRSSEPRPRRTGPSAQTPRAGALPGAALV